VACDVSSFVRKRCDVGPEVSLSVGGGRQEGCKFAMGRSEVVDFGTLKKSLPFVNPRLIDITRFTSSQTTSFAWVFP